MPMFNPAAMVTLPSAMLVSTVALHIAHWATAPIEDAIIVIMDKKKILLADFIIITLYQSNRLIYI